MLNNPFFEPAMIKDSAKSTKIASIFIWLRQKTLYNHRYEEHQPFF